MAEKFFVVRERMLPTFESSKRDGWYVFVSGPHGESPAARIAAHEAATANPGNTFTIIKIVGHAVADLVRDIEP